MTIQEIKESIDITQYIRSCGIELIGNGTELKAHCPFPDHEDRTPSFFVNTAKQVFNCFGCNRKGSVIDFACHYKYLSTAEAIRELSKQLEVGGSKFVEYAKDHGQEELQKSGNLATSHRSGAKDLPSNKRLSERGDVCVIGSSPESSCVDSRKHCGGTSSSTSQRVPSASEYSQGQPGRTSHASDRCQSAGLSIQRPADRNREGFSADRASSKRPNDSIKTVPSLTTNQQLPNASQLPTTNGSSSNHEPPTSNLLNDIAEYYHRALFGKDAQGRDYLKRRGIHDIEMLKRFQVGFVTGSLPRVLPKNRIDNLKECGVLNEKNREFFTNCVVVPLKNAQKQVVGFYGRLISAEKNGHFYLPGAHRGLLNAECAAVYDDIILVESVIDALSIYQHERKNVIPCYGTNGFTPLHESLIRKAGKPVIIAFDNDDVGKTAAGKLFFQLKQKGIVNGILQWPEGVKDANEFFAYNKDLNGRRTAEDFDKLLKKVKWINPATNKTPLKSTLKPQGLTLVKHTGNELIYQTSKLFYKLRGLYLNGVTSLKLVVTVSKDKPVKPDSITVTDRFDLYMAKSRKTFSFRVEEKLDLPASLVEDDLDRLIPKLEILREERNRKDEDPNQRTEMSEEEKKEALSFLKNPNLLGRIRTDLEIIGYAGEDTAKQLCYIIATSRKLAKPLSCIIRSESGAGKSYLMETVSELMPEEDIEYFSRLTPQSLYYMGKDRLVHKLLIVDERDGSEESEYPIRTLQTRRKLTLAVPKKDEHGTITTQILHINGPIAYMESSTSEHINPENLNRCFEIFLDESENQTVRIFFSQRQSKTMDGWKRECQKETIIQRHHNAQRLLKPIKVIIPYAELLDFPVIWTRGRRDHERFLNLIEAVAFLHQYQRFCNKSDNGEDYIEASIDDYKIAYKLAETVFSHSLSELPKNASLLYDRIKEMVAENCSKHGIKAKDYWFKRRNLREYSKVPDHQIKRTIKLLVDLDYLDIRRAGYGGTHFYHLTNATTTFII